MRPVGLRTPRLILDEPTLADAALVTSYCQDPLFERYLTTPWPYTRADAESFLGAHVPDSWASGSELTWAIRTSAGGILLGVISLRPVQRQPGSSELGFWMGAAHRESGFMSEAARAVAEWALGGDHRGSTSLLWRAVEGNVASAKVARAAGFRLIEPADATVPARNGGTLAAWHAVRTARLEPSAYASWSAILGAA